MKPSRFLGAVGLMALLTAVVSAVPDCQAAAFPQEPQGSDPHGLQQMPPGHPPVSTPGSPAEALPPVPPGSGVGTAGLEWRVPEGWISERPSSSLRRAQYRVPGAGGEGECVVFYFGPGQGGEPMANARRWAGQFQQPAGRPSTEVMETSELEVNGIEVLRVRVTGTYSGGMTLGSPRPPQANAMLLGAIARGRDANWFFKLTGPQTTLEENEEAFRSMIESLRRGEAGAEPASPP